jgi:hypothetical protein
MVKTKHGVTEISHSNEHQQFQNALVEKCVDIRAMLLGDGMFLGDGIFL